MSEASSMIVEDTAAAETEVGTDAAVAPETAETVETEAPAIPEGYVKVPGEDAKPEEIAAFHRALGVPDDPAGYEMDKVTLPEGVEFDAERAAALAPILQKRGVTPVAVRELIEADAAYSAQRAQAFANEFAQSIDTGRKALDQKWEKANLAVADMERGAVDAWKAFGDKDYAEHMKAHQIDRDPSVVAFAANAGAAFREALTTMIEGGVEPGKVQQFAKKYGFSTPEAAFVPGGSDIPADRRTGVLQYRDM